MHRKITYALVSAVLALFAVSADVPANTGMADPRVAFRRPAFTPFPEENPFTQAKADLGRRLFHDPVLSGDGNRACVSCHDPAHGWAGTASRASNLDGSDMAWRTPSLVNIAWQDGRMGWDGKFADVESVAFGPITSPGNMNLPEGEALRRVAAAPGYPEAFEVAFGDAGVTRKRIEDALATFERTLVSAPTSFDRFVEGEREAMGADARRGFALFTGKARCSACHSGWSMSDGSFHDVGVAREAEPGRGRMFPNSRFLQHAFKTPGLRDVARRAPYMHDGSLPSLEAVVDLYDKGGIDRPSRSPEIRPLNLSDREKADLVAFLKTLG